MRWGFKAFIPILLTIRVRRSIDNIFAHLILKFQHNFFTLLPFEFCYYLMSDAESCQMVPLVILYFVLFSCIRQTQLWTNSEALKLKILQQSEDFFFLCVRVYFAFYLYSSSGTLNSFENWEIEHPLFATLSVMRKRRLELSILVGSCSKLKCPEFSPVPQL